MRAYLPCLLLLASLVGLLQAQTTYQYVQGYYEGTPLPVFPFGESSSAAMTLGYAYMPVLIVPGSTYSGPDGGSIGIVQDLVCNSTVNRNIMSNSGSSLWNVQQAVVPDWAPTYDNCSAACTAAVNTSNTYSGGVNSYRRLVNVGDSLSTGGTASIGYYGYGYCGSPTPMAYFDFGDDNLGAKTGYAYVINANTTYIILGTVSTHFLTLVNITAPYMSGADGFRRVSDIPVAWLGDSSITVNSTIYEWGFTAVTATRPPGSDGFVLLPSFVVFLLSILSALLF